VDTTLRQLLMGSKRRAGNAVDTVMVCSQKTSSAVVATVMDPECERVACCAVGGTMVGATTGGAGGAVAGAALGTALGTVPALFTFGLSIPVGGLMGGGIGMTVGCTAGGTTGCIIGGMSFAYRKQIYSKALCTYDGALNSRVAASFTFAMDSLMTLLLDTTLRDIGMGAQRCVGEAASATCESTKKTGSAMKAVVLDPEYEKTAGCAVGGALVFGTAGGAAATCAGAAMGAAVGVLPALFTFGLSIPVGAVVGGGMGMTIGSAAGGTAGLAAGGASFAYRKEIASSVKNLYSSAYTSVSSVKSRAQAPVGSTGEPEGLVGSTGDKNLYSSAYTSVSSVKSRAQALVGSTGEPEGLVGSTGDKNLYSSAYTSVSSVKSQAQALVGNTGEPEGLVGSTGETESSDGGE